MGARSSTRPNIVLIMTDQQRFDQLGYASAGDFDTPQLDALASSGVIFDCAYSASTVCVPARNAILTGVQPHRLPTQENGAALREGTWTVARELRDAGYETALIGKMHFTPVHSEHGFETMRLCEHLSAQGFGPLSHERQDTVDDYHLWLVEQGLQDPRSNAGGDEPVAALPSDAHPTAWVERETTTFLANRDRSRPLFLVVSFPHPHAPYDPAEPYASMYDPADSTPPREGYDVNTTLPLAFQLFTEQSQTRGEAADPLRVRRFLATVRGLINHIDDAVGRVVAQLDLASTSVFFTSDHGDYAGHRGLMRKNPWITFDDLARVPLFACGAGVVGNRRLRGLVQTSDLAPTWLELAGIPWPDDLVCESRSLCGMLRAEPDADDGDRAVFSGLSIDWPMVRRGRYKYIEHRTHGKKGQAVLFDLDADPGETTNVIDDVELATERRELEELLDRVRAMPSVATVASTT